MLVTYKLGDFLKCLTSILDFETFIRLIAKFLFFGMEWGGVLISNVIVILLDIYMSFLDSEIIRD